MRPGTPRRRRVAAPKSSHLPGKRFGETAVRVGWMLFVALLLTALYRFAEQGQ